MEIPFKIVLVTICFLCVNLHASDIAAGNSQKILLLASFHQSHEWTRELIDSIINDCDKFNVNIEFEIDDFDAIRSPDKELQTRIWKKHLTDLKNGCYNILILLDDPAIEIALADYHDFPSDLSVVFAGYENPQPNLKKKYPNLTGVLQTYSPESTLHAAVALFPDVSKIIVYSDNTSQSIDFERRLKSSNLSFNGIRPIFFNAQNCKTKEVLQQISALQDSILLLSPWQNLYESDYQTLAAFATDLKRFCNRPFFVSGTAMFGYGALGGFVNDPQKHGHEVSHIVSDVIAQGSSRDVPIVTCPLIPKFDYQVMKKYQLDFSKLPPGTVLLNKPESFWRHYYHELCIIGAVLLILSCGGLFYVISMRRTLNQRHNLYSVLPGRIGVINRSEKLLFLKTEPIIGFDTSKMHFLRDIPGIDYKKISDAFQAVFHTGIPLTLEYEFRSVSRSLAVAPIPYKIFGEEAVVWLSHDNTELLRARNQAAALQRQVDIERQMLIDNMVIPVGLFNADGKLIRGNRYVQELTGLSHDQIIKTPCHELFQCGHLNDGQCPVQLVRHDHLPHKITYHYAGRDFIVDAKPVLDKSGQLLNIVESGMDVTDLNATIADTKVFNDCWEVLMREKDMDVGIPHALELLSNRLKASRSYIFQFDTQQKLVNCYREFVRPGEQPLFNNLKDQPYCCTPDWEKRFEKNAFLLLEDIVHDGELQGMDPLWIKFLSDHHIHSIFCHRLILDGKFWGYFGMIYEHELHKLTVQEKKFISSAAHFIEVMIRRQIMHNQLVTAMKQAQAAEKAKSFFIANVSHEIRTPLNAIIGFAELLHSTNLSKNEQNDYLDCISYSSNALLQLINDVLDLSKLEADQMKFEPESIDFAQLAHEVMPIFKFKAKEKDITFNLDLAPLPIMELDKLRVRQILFNLIGNATKFTQYGSITLRASFSQTSDNCGTFDFSVEDTGIGITEEDQQRLMEPFVQLSSPHNAGSCNNGTGLGLAISKRLAEKMNGNIYLRSKYGCGSTFGVMLRNVIYHKEHSIGIQSVKINNGNSLQPITSGLSVIAVDDVKMNLKVIAALSKKLGITDIRLAASGTEALEMLKERISTLVFTDLWMPNMNGEELAAEIRKNKAYANVKLVALTADIDSKANFNMSEFDYIMTKPVSINKLHDLFFKLS